MNILLIEDEELAADDLVNAIKKAAPTVQVKTILVSVKESISYLKQHTLPDLIFSDIQLGDGLSFEIFDAVRIETPIIFCTAYNEYMLDAFRSNGIDYLLKPVTVQAVSEALNKYYTLKRNFTANLNLPHDFYRNLLDTIVQRPVSLLVNQKDKIIPLSVQDIALFYIEYEGTFLQTFEGKSFTIAKSLEELERLIGMNFFRVNRQYLISRLAVKHASYSISRKLIVNLSIPYREVITVSKEKSPLFLSWLAGN